MKKYIPFLSILLFLFACELIVDVDVPLKKAQLTVNSFFNPDSVWSTTVSQNRYILSDVPFQSVENAVVVIYQNNSPIDTLVYQKEGGYKSDTGKPSIGEEYEIRASAAGYETVISKSKIPTPTEITHIETRLDPLPGESPVNIINITLKDNPAEINYYEIRVHIEDEYYDPISGKILTRRYGVSIESNDPLAKNDDTNSAEGVLIKDILFNGKEVELSFKTSNYNIGVSSALFISLRTLSEDGYKYETTVQLQNNTSGNPFAQPVNVYNNIKNGFGIFAGYGQSTFIRSSARPVITGISPSQGKPGDHVIISGENLLYSNVSFTSSQYPIHAQTVRSTENETEVIIPDRAITGKIIVYNNGKIALSNDEFEVMN